MKVGQGGARAPQQAQGGKGGGQAQGQQQEQGEDKKAEEMKQLGEALVSGAVDGSQKTYAAANKASSACSGLDGGGEANPVSGRKIEGLKGSPPPPGGGGMGMGGAPGMGGMGPGMDQFQGSGGSPFARPSGGGRQLLSGMMNNFAGTF
ncbi:MAG: hypothetical protein KC910_02255 [Candidatus Eremiobacteraeota bacterium]|nr:hypothetical protein [Candidatus Eremiobacteraeota bacterium]